MVIICESGCLFQVFLQLALPHLVVVFFFEGNPVFLLADGGLGWSGGPVRLGERVGSLGRGLE